MEGGVVAENYQMASDSFSGGGGGGNGDKSKWKLDETSTADAGKRKSADGFKEENIDSKKSRLPVTGEGGGSQGLEAQSTQQTRQEKGKGFDVESERETPSNSEAWGETNAEEEEDLGWDMKEIAELVWGPSTMGPPHKGEKELPKGASNALANFSFTISGELDSQEFEEARNLIESHGGKFTCDFRKANYVVADEEIRGWYSVVIKEFGVRILTEDELFAMINATGHITSDTDSERPNIVRGFVASH